LTPSAFYIILYDMERGGSLIQVLQAAEQKALAVLAEAAGAGDLEGVDKARRVVGELRAMSIELGQQRQNPNRATNSAPGTNGGPKRKPVSRKSTKKDRGQKYPEFFARHETLYRRAWSRKKGGEYEHKAPRQTVDEVVRAMASIAGGEAKPVSVESIVAKVNRSSAVSIPQYQVYLVIGWLRNAEQIEQVGRDGYQIPPDIAQKTRKLWQELDLRSSKLERQ
jgi:hypothetical protein